MVLVEVDNLFEFVANFYVVEVTICKMLEYENQMFLDILHEDGLLISAK